ncbi:MAG: hypothetical protein OSA84_10230 [Akkermansiaceae bacterium]|nr:hypothetical protein [Akkermansiaceae bacterium]
MKTKLLLSLPLVGCFAFVSCYPVHEGPRKPSKPKGDETVTSEDQQKLQEQRDRMTERDEQDSEEMKKPDADTTTSKPKEDTKKGDYAFATPVPGKEGFVFSPYNNKLVDVRDIPSGTLVQDPTYPAAEKKYFRVP